MLTQCAVQTIIVINMRVLPLEQIATRTMNIEQIQAYIRHENDTHTHTHMHARTHACTHTHTHTHTHTLCTYMGTHTHVRTHTHTNTNIHTDIIILYRDGTLVHGYKLHLKPSYKKFILTLNCKLPLTMYLVSGLLQRFATGISEITGIGVGSFLQGYCHDTCFDRLR